MSSINHDDFVNKTDEEVLSQSLSDPDIFQIIVERYEKPFISRILSIVKNKEEAEDIVQNTFVKIYVHGLKFQPRDGASFKSWAYKILMNTCFTRMRNLKRDSEYLSNVEPEILQNFSERDDTERRLNINHFLFIVSKLPRSAAKILKKVVFEGKTHEQIAQEEGLSIGAARTRLHRAKSEFKKVDEGYKMKTENKNKNA